MKQKIVKLIVNEIEATNRMIEASNRHPSRYPNIILTSTEKLKDLDLMLDYILKVED